VGLTSPKSAVAPSTPLMIPPRSADGTGGTEIMCAVRGAAGVRLRRSWSPIKQGSGVSCSVCNRRRCVTRNRLPVTDLGHKDVKQRTTARVLLLPEVRDLVLRGLRCLGPYPLAFYHRILPATSRSPKVERHLPHLSSTRTHTQVALRQRTKSAEGKHGKTARECRDEALPYLAPPINMATNVSL
jgi:hypothetical protein